MSSKLEWCMDKKNGIKLIDPNDNLTQEYLESSNEDLENAKIVTGKWRTVTSYYACYNALYAYLSKVGIKSEIHDCTIELMGTLGYDKKHIDFLKELKERRVDVQYYLKEPQDIELSKVKGFIKETKSKIKNTDDFEIEELRKKLEGLAKN